MSSLEQVVDRLLGNLSRVVGMPDSRPVPWPDFARAARHIHGSFNVPATSVSPVMRRFFYGVGYMASPRSLVGVGTYVGYAFAWLLLGSDASPAPFEVAVGVDTDLSAVRVARKNIGLLSLAGEVIFVAGDARSVFRSRSVGIGRCDLLLLDLDDPAIGKKAYTDVLDSMHGQLAPGALILAHDPLVPRFKRDFERFHDYVVGHPEFAGPWVLPMDRCGVSVSMKRREPNSD